LRLRFGDGAHSLCANQFEARVPDFRRPDFRRGVAKDEALDSLRCVDAEPHTDHSAHGETAEVSALDSDGVEESEDVATELSDAVGAGSDGGLAVAARVVPQNSIFLRERGNLRIPH